MSSSIGDRVRVSLFGESHGRCVGCVIDGLPAGEAIDMDEVLVQMEGGRPAGTRLRPRAAKATSRRSFRGCWTAARRAPRSL